VDVGWHEVASLSGLPTTDGLAQKAREWLTRYQRCWTARFDLTKAE